LSYNTLKKFVKEQAIRGEDPSRLKQGLLLNGWDRADVDRVISEVYGFKRKVLRTGLIVVVLLIVVLSLSLLLIYNDFSGVSVDDSSVVVPSVDVVDDSCLSLREISLKEACYLEEIKNGFYCEDLDEIESFFCSRVLENYIIEEYSDSFLY